MSSRLLSGLAALVLWFASPGWAADAPATPEDACRAYFSALAADGLTVAPEYIHPEELARFRDMLIPMFSEELAPGNDQIVEAFFGPGATRQTANDASPLEFMRAFMRMFAAKLEQVGVRFDAVEIIGSVPENDLVHVVTRVTMGTGPLSVQQVQVVTLKQHDGQWKVMLGGQIEGLAQAIRSRLPHK